MTPPQDHTAHPKTGFQRSDIMSTDTLLLLKDPSISNLIGKACLNPVNEFEDLQYKVATMQALR